MIDENGICFANSCLETVLNFTNQNNFGTKAILSSSFLSFFVSSNF